MCAVGAFSVCEMCFCTYFTYYAICISIYFEVWVLDVLFYEKRNAYLLKFVRQWLNNITYPWISAPFDEISGLGYSLLLMLRLLRDLGYTCKSSHLVPSQDPSHAQNQN